MKVSISDFKATLEPSNTCSSFVSFKSSFVCGPVLNILSLMPLLTRKILIPLNLLICF
jgi:hypothetical protein